MLQIFLINFSLINSLVLYSSYDIDINFENDPFYDTKFDEKMIFDFLRKMNANKAAGPDGLQSKLIKSQVLKDLLDPYLIYSIISLKLEFYPINGSLEMLSLFSKRAVKVL